MTAMHITRATALRASVLGFIMGPCLLCAWTPGTYPAGSTNFTVNTAVRNDVVAFWHGVYQASEGYQDRLGWTGNYDAPAPNCDGQGTTSAAFVTDVERRLNYFRAMCNVPATATMNTGATVLIDATDPTNLYHPASTPPLAAATTKSAAAQRAAYMIIRTYGYADTGGVHPPLAAGAYGGLYHEPDAAKCVAWTTAAWNANHLGNLAMGFYGPGAINAYMAEDVSGTSTWNSDAGHRRMLIHPVSTNFATGDTPGSYDPVTAATRPPTNVTYVAPRTSEIAAVLPRFVTYPPAGFFPAALNATKYWSLSYPGAGFGAATVTMTTAGGAAISTPVVSRAATFGYPAITWQVTGTAAAIKAVTADTTFNVTVAGITGGAGVPASYSYSVTLINPNQITSDQALFGPTAPATDTPTRYQFTPPPQAEAIQVNCFQPQTAWAETAEDTQESQVIANTSGTYEFRSTANFPGYYPTYFAPISGAKSFRLTIPVRYDPRLNGPPEQSFELARDILPGDAASLNFVFRRGYMTAGTNLVIESTSDGGASWTQLGATLSGNGNGDRDAGPIADARSLAVSASPIRIRFRFFVSPGQGFYADQADASYNWPAIPTGILIDDISTTNCQWLELKKTNDLAAAASSFEFNSAAAGVELTHNLELRLRLRTKLGNRWMPYGPMKWLTLKAAAQTPAPTFSPAVGHLAAGETITISGESGATIFYRLNGGAEQSGASPVTGLTAPAYPGQLFINAYSKKAEKADSAIVEGFFMAMPQQPTSVPVFSPAAGEYRAGQPITLTGDGGATIYYRLNGGAEQSAASPVAGLVVPAYPDSLAISAYASKAGFSNSASVNATYTSSPLKTWANTYFPGVTDPAIIGPAADPDKDGQPNVLEFGLGGNPNGGRDQAKTYPLTNDGTATRKLLLTLAVRAGTPAFAGSPSPSATSEGVTYAILGGLGLTLWDSPVSVVTPPQTAGLPAAPAGYEYRTFKLNAADGLPSKGFLRVRVTMP